MKKTLIILMVILTSNVAHAQFIKGKFISAQIGYAVSQPKESVDEIAGRGFIIQGELSLLPIPWVELRPYAAYVSTSSNGKDVNNYPTDEKVETKAILLGGKTRVLIPIHWLTLYIETGIGTSIGKFETLTAYHNIDKSGIIFHIPVGFGIDFGKKNSFNLGFTYYFQPSVEQDIGTVGIGMTFPLKNKK